ncbi:helix-turn-helix transcriptional regulator [Bifidobacterium pseudolongum]|uniref:helix-turn-helix transcriptional regulator n=1 Tax=Bifidobacterium pseudolongum TaxID=1694 RepID=UPI00263F81AC|nr:helix-turn-helix transcriptional regulator [Bifidobacterium pseudolongum]
MTVTQVKPQIDVDGAARFLDIVRYNIRRYMRLTGKLQKDLAHAMGISRPAVTLILNGTTKPKLDQIYLAASALGVTVNDLIDDTYYVQDETFIKQMHDSVFNTELTKIPTATRREDDSKLLRLGLNQRPSD